MYYPGQVVWDLDSESPTRIGDNVWDPNSYPRRHIHFVYTDGRSVALPVSVSEAWAALDRHEIMPAPWPETHCESCMNWKSNPPNGGCRAPWVHTYRPQGAKP